jgi:hypothetical protein
MVNEHVAGRGGYGYVPSDGCRSSTTEYPLRDENTMKREMVIEEEGKGRGRRSVVEARRMPGTRGHLIL